MGRKGGYGFVAEMGWVECGWIRVPWGRENRLLRIMVKKTTQLKPFDKTELCTPYD